MKKIFLVMVFLIFGTISMAGKTAYVMVPENYSELYVIGIDEFNGKYVTEETSEEETLELEGSLDTEEYLKENPILDNKIRIFKKSYYGGTKLLKIMTNNEKDIKIVVGYKHTIKNDSNVDEEKYVVLASKEIDYTKLETNYKNDNIPKQQIINFGTYDYSDFPGHEVKENLILSGIRVGEKRTREELASSEEIEEYDVPKNIVDKFELDGEEIGQSVKMYAGINPNNSDDKFEVKDKNEDVFISMKKVEIPKNNNKTQEVDGIEINGVTYVLHDDRDDLKANDIIEVKDGGVYLNGNKTSEIEGPFMVTIRIKNQLTTSNDKSIVEIDGEEEKFTGNTKNYGLSEVSKFQIIYSGSGNGFDFKMEADDNEEVITGDGPTSKKSPVYVLEGEGLKYEADVLMTSGEQKRSRISDVNIEVLENGSSGFEVKSIKE